MEATILTVLGLFATVTLWILSGIKSELRDFKTEIKSDIKGLETRIGTLEKSVAILIEAQGNLDKRVMELTSEVKRNNQNFLDHLRHDHGIRLGEREVL